MEQIGNSLAFKAFFVASKVGATGLTVTWDVYKPDGTKIVTAGSGTEVGGGLYTYTLASGSVTVEGEYLAIAKTSGTADQQHIPSLWTVGRGGVEHLDADVSSRATPTQVDASVAAATGGGGEIPYTHHVTDTGANPISGVRVTLRGTDAPDGTIIAAAKTNDLGDATFHLETAGTYYASFYKSGWNFDDDNPTEIEVTA